MVDNKSKSKNNSKNSKKSVKKYNKNKSRNKSSNKSINKSINKKNVMSEKSGPIHNKGRKTKKNTRIQQGGYAFLDVPKFGDGKDKDLNDIFEGMPPFPPPFLEDDSCNIQ